MKKLKKLSLKKEIEREAEALEKEVSGRKDLDHITVSEDMEEALFQKIQDYEYEKRAKVVYRKKKRRYAIIAVAAVFILVFGSVMTGVGSKSYWKVWWDRDESGEKASYIDVENMDLQEIYLIEKQKRVKHQRGMRKVMKRRILSILGSAVLLCGIVAASATNVRASDRELKQVDGSYLTTEERSIGYTSSPDLRGVHLMDGESIISKAGISRIYAYGSTTANHEVKYIATIVYVDQYDEKNDEWGQIDAWVAEDENNYYLSTAKSLKVDRGYYYRVHCDHIAGNEYPYEENASTTNGILIP